MIRLSGTASPGLRARLYLRRQRSEGDLAPGLVERLVRPGDVALDVGARWGTYTVLLSRAVGPAGAVHAFEPNRQHSRALHAIARSSRNVRFHPFALSDRAGTSTLHLPVVGDRVADGRASLAPPPGEHRRAQVERRRLDDLRLPRVDFVKCDVEGHELAVFSGGVETLRRLRPAVLVEIEQRHPGADLVATLDFLRGLGYAAYMLAERGLRPASEFDVERDQLRVLERQRASGWMMPPAYVHEFVFVRPTVDLRDVLGASAAD